LRRFLASNPYAGVEFATSSEKWHVFGWRSKRRSVKWEVSRYFTSS
jgi:hypothetical protein